MAQNYTLGAPARYPGALPDKEEEVVKRPSVSQRLADLRVANRPVASPAEQQAIAQRLADFRAANRPTPVAPPSAPPSISERIADLRANSRPVAQPVAQPASYPRQPVGRESVLGASVNYRESLPDEEKAAVAQPSISQRLANFRAANRPVAQPVAQPARYPQQPISREPVDRPSVSERLADFAPIVSERFLQTRGGQKLNDIIKSVSQDGLSQTRGGQRLGEIIGSAVQGGSDLLNQATSTASDLYDTGIQAGSDLVNQVKNNQRLTGIVDSATQVGSNLLNQARENVTTAARGVYNTGKSLAGQATQRSQGGAGNTGASTTGDAVQRGTNIQNPQDLGRSNQLSGGQTPTGVGNLTAQARDQLPTARTIGDYPTAGAPTTIPQSRLPTPTGTTRIGDSAPEFNQSSGGSLSVVGGFDPVAALETVRRIKYGDQQQLGLPEQNPEDLNYERILRSDAFQEYLNPKSGTGNTSKFYRGVLENLSEERKARLGAATDLAGLAQQDVQSRRQAESEQARLGAEQTVAEQKAIQRQREAIAAQQQQDIENQIALQRLGLDTAKTEAQYGPGGLENRRVAAQEYSAASQQSRRKTQDIQDTFRNIINTLSSGGVPIPEQQQRAILGQLIQTQTDNPEQAQSLLSEYFKAQ